MLWAISCRVIATILGFVLGWAVFQVVRPVAELPGLYQRAPEIRSITLKRQGGIDSQFECSVYDVTFRSDGTGTFIGYKNNGDYDGKFDTNFDPHDFDLLVYEFEKQHFFELAQHYETTPDTETVVLEVVTSEGVRVVTTHNWSTTPSALRVLHALVDYQSYQMDWTKAE
ncbi:MAG TPA: DUF6438 domain-containing protein [Pyrinomonadaceae bacterium]|nr:DUF6438 domain-containing protein [Pyrinomonadaceae bacterium]